MTRRLGFRLILLFGIFLLPLALLNSWQIYKYQHEASRRAEETVLGWTMQAALPVLDRITRTESAVGALAVAVGAHLGDDAGCNRLLADFMAQPGNAEFVVAVYVPMSMVVTCSPQGPRDFRGQADLQAALVAGQPVVEVRERGPVSGESVLMFSHPVYDRQGRPQGMVGVSLRYDQFGGDLSGRQAPTDDVVLITTDSRGTALAANIPLAKAQAHIPLDFAVQAATGPWPHSFSSSPPGGEARTYTLVPLAERGLFLLGDWPVPERLAGPVDGNRLMVLLPIVMWLSSLVLAHLANKYYVLRYMHRLRRSIAAFAAGGRRVQDLKLDRAPEEFRMVGLAFGQMVASVLRNEAELEDTIHQKEVLLREVHHRVKNNLQLIASIINMQIRKTDNPETRDLLRALQDRVMSLATIHRELYQTTGVTDVRADELLGSIAGQVQRIALRPGQPVVEVVTRLADIRLTPDQAVPLSLLVTEALTRALKHAAPPALMPDTLPRVELLLERADDGLAEMTVRNTAGAAMPGAARGEDGLGAALMQGFATQLGTEIIRGFEGGDYVLRFRFAPKALAVAEERLTLGI